MRDLVLALLVFGSIPFILRRPYIGLLFWVWLSIMNPHRLTYGFAYALPFAQVVALATLTGMLFNVKRLYKVEMNAGVWSLIVFTAWVCVSPLFSFHNSGELDLWLRVIKILVMVLVTFFVVGTRQELHVLTLVLTFSIAFYGIKGGFFTVATAGSYKVYGPDASFVADNNSVACAIIMAVPLIRYAQMQATRRLVRVACAVAMLLCVAAAVGSYSRGALVGLGAMGFFLWWKGRNKIIIGAAVLALVMIIFSFMPESWMNRMSTLEHTDSDASAQGRINAWWMAFNLAKSRIFIGGGFNIYTPELFARFAPVPEDIHAAHSIYFQVLGEHGFVGLAIFLFIFLRVWTYGSWVLRNARGRPDLKWALDLVPMCQVSLIGYGAAGAFLSLSYYDFPYYVAAILIITRGLVHRALKEAPATATAAPAAMRSKGQWQ